MRHAKKNNHLSRKAPHRKAMLSNMACSLIKHKRIKTTLAKAKALRVYLEPLITKSKNDTTHSRRVVFSYLKQKEIVTELFGEVATKITDRPGGYTRIIRLSNRIGDNSKMCFIELVDYNEVYVKDIVDKKSKRRRSRSKTKSLSETPKNESTPKNSEKEASLEDSTQTPKSVNTGNVPNQNDSVADSKNKDRLNVLEIDEDFKGLNFIYGDICYCPQIESNSFEFETTHSYKEQANFISSSMFSDKLATANVLKSLEFKDSKVFFNIDLIICLSMSQ